MTAALSQLHKFQNLVSFRNYPALHLSILYLDPVYVHVPCVVWLYTSLSNSFVQLFCPDLIQLMVESRSLTSQQKTVESELVLSCNLGSFWLVVDLAMLVAGCHQCKRGSQ